MSYTDKKGKRHRNCHSSRKGAQRQISAIEAEGADRAGAEILAEFVREFLLA
jgi:hypothetical protein